MGKPQSNQVKTTCYANSAQMRAIRAKMVAAMSELGAKGDLKTLVKGLIQGNTGEEIAKECSRTIFPIKDCHIRKVKVLKKPKFDVTALMEWHTDDSGAAADVGTAVDADAGLAGAGGRL